jgi:hypothetical protein
MAIVSVRGVPREMEVLFVEGVESRDPGSVLIPGGAIR